MLGKLNAEEMEQLLGQQLVGRIGCHTEEQIYVVPISYAYDGTYIYCHTFDGMKIDIMRKNPNVCFEVDDTRDLANWRSVIAWGVFEELTDKVQRREGLNVLKARQLPILSSETMHLGAYWPFSTPSASDDVPGIIFRIHLHSRTGRFEKASGKNYYAT